VRLCAHLARMPGGERFPEDRDLGVLNSFSVNQN
jgi:hypothetical protein